MRYENRAVARRTAIKALAEAKGRKSAVNKSPLVFKYHSGEEIRKGDRILFFGNPAEIEDVFCEFTGDPSNDWMMQEKGGGIMISDPMVSGRTFIPISAINGESGIDQMQFVSRPDGGSK